MQFRSQHIAGIPSAQLKNRHLLVSVWAEESKKTRLIGECKVELEVLVKSGESDEWYEMQDDRGKYAGEIYLESTFYSNAKPPRRRNADGLTSSQSSYALNGSMSDASRSTNSSLHSSAAGSIRNSISLSQIPLYRPEYSVTSPPLPSQSLGGHPTVGNLAAYRSDSPVQQPLYAPAPLNPKNQSWAETLEERRRIESVAMQMSDVSIGGESGYVKSMSAMTLQARPSIAQETLLEETSLEGETSFRDYAAAQDRRANGENGEHGQTSFQSYGSLADLISGPTSARPLPRPKEADFGESPRSARPAYDENIRPDSPQSLLKTTMLSRTMHNSSPSPLNPLPGNTHLQCSVIEDRPVSRPLPVPPR